MSEAEFLVPPDRVGVTGDRVQEGDVAEARKIVDV
jgi:hypothetical protein